MTGPIDYAWSEQFAGDIQYGFVNSKVAAHGQFAPRVILNQAGSTVEHALIEELRGAEKFAFSVAFISAGAIAQLKQHLKDFKGAGTIVTSDYLGFNTPTAFAELLNLKRRLGIDVRIHSAEHFHPKGYIFTHERNLTAMVGSANLTSDALSRNHEWTLKVSAADGSDLATQLEKIIGDQVLDSTPLTQDWIDKYAETFVAPPQHHTTRPELAPGADTVEIQPNPMQQDALLALDFVRAQGERRAIVISATGTGKTMLTALDVRSVNPARMLFIVHREQILLRTIREFKKVLGGPDSDYGLLTGTSKDLDSRYVFATVQTLSQRQTLGLIPPHTFNYVVIDEAHHAGAETYRRVIDHLNPDFLLGLTATPERTDGFNVFELFDYNVPYEIRLGKALESEMLAPFHYYGISDLAFDDEDEPPADVPLGVLITPERVLHLIEAIELYGQAGVAPRGLIFCSRVDEARALSHELNLRPLNGRRLRTVVLAATDSIQERDTRVAQLEAGELDYILTVDLFNEGVDIPSINQVIMLRQTQSAIVFVQQLGRGLRLAEGKEHLVVIDFIGNYANNFMIPIALFGDESLNRESLRERLNETVEAGALPGLSSVSFDEVSRERVLKSIGRAQLDSLSNLKIALVAMRNRVGRTPTLMDFQRFESVDPVLLATKKEHFPALVQSLLREPSGLTEQESKALQLLSHEVLAAKRLHEFVLLRLLLDRGVVSTDAIGAAFSGAGISADPVTITSVVDTFTLDGYAQSDLTRYVRPLAIRDSELVRLTPEFRDSYATSSAFRSAVDDVLVTGEDLTGKRYRRDVPFTPGLQYSRRDAARLLGWDRTNQSTIYGVKVDTTLGVSAIFVTLEKSDEVAASTAYKDQLLDPSTMRWFTKSNRRLDSADVAPIVKAAVDVHVFVKKDDAEGTDHYYLGQATAHDAVQTVMPDGKGGALPVVEMHLRFDEPVRQGLFDYFSPRSLV